MMLPTDKLLAAALPLALTLVSCTGAMPAVPASNHNRTVVAPSGTTKNLKPWSNPTKQEGDATLGPLSGISERR